MNSASLWQWSSRSFGLWVGAWLCLNASACFRTLDVSKIKCVDNSNCPSNYSCSRSTGEWGTCAPSTDGSTADVSVSPGTGGDGGGLEDGPRGGADGRTSDDGTGGADGRSDGRADGAGGATGAVDAPVGGAVGGATGGMTSGGTSGAVDAPVGGAGGATGGTTSGGAGGSTGGTTSTPVDAVFANGASCTANGQCASTHCIDSVCCESTCTGCSACSNALTGLADGTCGPVVSGKNHQSACTDETATKPCGNDGTCDGKGACRKVGAGQRCADSSCSPDGSTFTPESKCDGNGTCLAATPQPCAPYQCVATGCAKICTKQSDCDAGNYCNITAGTCATQKTNGATATQTYECASGIIADRVCCDKDCTGCSACTAALNGQATNTTGTCMAVTAAKAADPHGICPAASDPCGMDGTCNGNGGCHYAAVGSDCGTPSCNSSTSMLTKSACSSSHVCTAGSATPCDGSRACASASACKTGACSANAECASGYVCTSGSCESNHCSPNPCQNGGTCLNAVLGYTCTCATGYGGTNCQTNINECSPNPCLNGGTCVDGVASYTCNCPTGYTGTRCETNINDCSPNPCQHGGTCVDGVASHTCNCVNGYGGTNCQTCAGYDFSSCGGGCGSWGFESGGAEIEWVKDTDPSWPVSGGAENGVSNISSTTTHYEGSRGLVVVGLSNGGYVSVAAPVCSGSTINMAGFTMYACIMLTGTELPIEGPFVFFDAWNASNAVQNPALTGEKLAELGVWHCVNTTFSLSAPADHVAIRFNPGLAWTGNMYIDSVKITGL